MVSCDLKELGSRLPTKIYCERNSRSQRSLGRYVCTEAMLLGDHEVVRLEISLMRSSKASSRWENDLLENSNLAMHESFFSFRPITTEDLLARDSRSA